MRSASARAQDRRGILWPWRCATAVRRGVHPSAQALERDIRSWLADWPQRRCASGLLRQAPPPRGKPAGHHRAGRNPSLDPSLPGGAHNLTAARRHRILASCVRLTIPVVADRAYQGDGDGVAVPHQRKPRKNLTLKQKRVNRAHSRLRWPAERTLSSIKTCRILRKARSHPNNLTSITKASLTLETRH
ncbi:transposase family protein [Streptomyces sp. NPDC005533]|uniref:transposase family protein n=1 Tax=Streptomyces sp. NPDC005533 TaxID=3364723 RepID=UPI0036AD5414